MNNFSLHTPLNLAPSGIASFAKCDICSDIRAFDADIAILGAPFDLAIQGRSGARLGPRGIRVASTRFSYKPGGTYDYERDRMYMDTNRWRVLDCGDVDYVPGDLDSSFANLTEAVRILLSRGALPVVLGGQTRSNGSPMRNAAALPHVGKVLHLGIRGIGSSGPDDFAEAKAHGDKVYSVKQTRAAGIQRILEDLPRGGNVYVTMDIDGLDAGLAPGTGSPIFGGFQYDETVEILEAIAGHSHVIGLDMVEVSPPYDDAATTTCYLAARLISDMLGFVTNAREGGN